MPTMFKVIPTAAISEIFNLPVLKTIAFGGVEIGSINASEEEIVAGTIILMGGIPSIFEIEATIGRKVDATAVFDENSVVATTIIDTITITKKGDRWLYPTRFFARKSDNPVRSNPSAIAKPPPKRRIMSQGTFFKSSTFKILSFE